MIVFVAFALATAAVVVASEEKHAKLPTRPTSPDDSAASERHTDTGNTGGPATSGVDATGEQVVVKQTETGPVIESTCSTCDDGKVAKAPTTAPPTTKDLPHSGGFRIGDKKHPYQSPPIIATPTVNEAVMVKMASVNTSGLTKAAASERYAEFAGKGGFVV